MTVLGLRTISLHTRTQIGHSEVSQTARMIHHYDTAWMSSETGLVNIHGVCACPSWVNWEYKLNRSRILSCRILDAVYSYKRISLRRSQN